MAFSFRGGIHPNSSKSATNQKPIEIMPAPNIVILPVSMHIGAPCRVLVNVSDTVDLGQPIAEPVGFVSAPVHATVSGKVIAVEPRLHPNGSKVLSVVIENDFEDRLHSSVTPLDFDHMTNDERIEAIQNGGIVGHGGATFPAHVKIKSGVGKVDVLILNGAECEPYITSDHRMLLEHADEIVGGARMLLRILGVKKAYIGIEDNKKDVFPEIIRLCAGIPELSLAPLKSKYPQGAEKQLIYAVTGREVPSGKLPADARCAVFNVDTAASIYRLFTYGRPVLRRIVTVSGSAIREPKNLHCRIGTPLKDLVAACGGFQAPPNKLIMGGPMMGVSQFSLDVPVIKGTNAFLAFCGKEDARVEHPVCIRCGKCVEACPIHLLPIYMNISAANYDLEACREDGVLDCIECGSCAFVCPAKIPLVQQFRAAKQRIIEQNRTKSAK